MKSKKELLMSVLTDALVEMLYKKYNVDYFSALQVVLASKTYRDLFDYEWFRNEGPVYIQSCFEQEINSSPKMQQVLEI